MADGMASVATRSNVETFDSHVLSLPDEIILLILCFVEPRDLTNLARVCRRLSAICSEENMWKTNVAKSLSMPVSAESVCRKPRWQSWRHHFFACAVPPCKLARAPDGVLPTEMSRHRWLDTAFKDSFVFIPDDNRVLVYEMIGPDRWLLNRTLVLDDGTSAADCSVVGKHLLVRFFRGDRRRGFVAFDAGMCRCGALEEDFDEDDDGYYALHIVPLGDKLFAFHGSEQNAPALVENVTVVRLAFNVVGELASVGDERVAFFGNDVTGNGFTMARDEVASREPPAIYQIDGNLEEPPAIYQIDGRLKEPTRLDAKPSFSECRLVGVSNRLLLLSFNLGDRHAAAMEALCVDDGNRTVVALGQDAFLCRFDVLSVNDLLYVVLSTRKNEPRPYTVLCFNGAAELLWRRTRSSAEFWPDVVVDGWQPVKSRPAAFATKFHVLPDGSIVCSATYALFRTASQADVVSRLLVLRHGC
eukprot:TRINITY_DN8721_c0_g1_i1.p1 TRINITY_DN8721_c0_g1~~TRINITY_DN8721_c0_g1_i1.p1  ORF type:complete len:473 (+),score=80.48 TRINITY_DN8721_c0_g1_i1:207-1625(+)